MQKNFILFILFISAATVSNGQDKPATTSNARDNPTATREYDMASFGLGFGFDYGGIGLNFVLYPQENVGIFGGVGYAIAGIGYNVGFKFRLAPEKSFTPFVMIMFGYNTAISVSGGFNSTFNGNQNKFFYGPTAGIGFDLGKHKKNGYFSLALTIPFRGSDVDNYITQLRNSGATFSNSLSSVGISLGYHF
jgi:hypothetical protein